MSSPSSPMDSSLMVDPDAPTQAMSYGATQAFDDVDPEAPTQAPNDYDRDDGDYVDPDAPTQVNYGNERTITTPSTNLSLT